MLNSKKTAEIVATYFGLGLSPKAPGTVGSFGTLPLAFILAYFTGIYGIVAVATICFIAGVLATDVIIRNQKEKDPGKVVIDEVVGQLLAFSFVCDYLYQNLHNWWIYLFGFAAFRFFDICKMGPVKWFDAKMKNAYGVMLDDVCAGLMAAFTLWLFVKFGVVVFK